MRNDFSEMKNAEYITDKKKELTDAERFDTLILISKSIRGMREM